MRKLIGFLGMFAVVGGVMLSSLSAKAEVVCNEYRCWHAPGAVVMGAAPYYYGPRVGVDWYRHPGFRPGWGSRRWHR